jgi:hypothetical protein
VFHLVGKPFLKVEFPGWVIGIGIRFDFDMSLDECPTGQKQAPFGLALVDEGKNEKGRQALFLLPKTLRGGKVEN